MSIAIVGVLVITVCLTPICVDMESIMPLLIVLALWVPLSLIMWLIRDAMYNSIVDDAERRKKLEQLEDFAFIDLPDGRNIRCPVSSVNAIRDGKQFEIASNGATYVVNANKVRFTNNRQNNNVEVRQGGRIK